MDARGDLDGLGAVFDHAAIAAPRIRDLLPIYRDLLGGRFLFGGDNVRTGFRFLQLAFRDGSRVELLEPLRGSTFLDSFFASRGSGGLHHVTFKVPDMRRAVRLLRERGYRMHGLNLDNPSWQEVFLHPKEAHGTLVQLACSPEGDDVDAGLTMEDVLAGRGERGSGVPSP